MTRLAILHRVAITAAAAGLLAACTDTRHAPAAKSHAPDTHQVTVSPTAPAGVIDSILPLDEDIRRFQADVADPGAFSAHATSREALVRQFVVRLAARDTAALRAMLVTRAEFAWLVYPGSSYTRAPYRTPPGLVWMQLTQDAAKGISRLLRPELRVDGCVRHHCAGTPVRDGAVTLSRGCTVEVTVAGGGTRSGRLFGVIVEHAGRFKFASYETDF
jgi:hypothetical protein